MLTALVASILAVTQPQPGSIADQASRPLWRVVDEPNLLVAVDRPRPVETPGSPFDATVWVFQPLQNGVDAIASAITVDCAARSLIHHNFTGYVGMTFVGASAAADTSARAAEPGTVFGAIVEYLCDAAPDAVTPPDFATFVDVQIGNAAATDAP